MGHFLFIFILVHFFFPLQVALFTLPDGQPYPFHEKDKDILYLHLYIQQ